MKKQLMQDLEYWTNAMVRCNEEIDEYRTKMYVNVLPLSIEDQYPLRELLTRQSANLVHLKGTLARIQDDAEAKKFKLLNR